MADIKGTVDGGGSVEESGVRGAVGGEFDGERVVFFADWEGWWVNADDDGFFWGVNCVC